jgi:succinyl-CoA synthetase alpha subunit
MGHAGAIISGGKGTAIEKMNAMKKAGIKVIESPAEIGSTMLKAIEKDRSQRPEVRGQKKSKVKGQKSKAKIRISGKSKVRKEKR